MPSQLQGVSRFLKLQQVSGSISILVVLPKSLGRHTGLPLRDPEPNHLNRNATQVSRFVEAGFHDVVLLNRDCYRIHEVFLRRIPMFLEVDGAKEPK